MRQYIDSRHDIIRDFDLVDSDRKYQPIMGMSMKIILYVYLLVLATVFLSNN